MRIMGLDIGTRRIGVALSDELGVMGLPLTTVQVDEDGGHLRTIAELCAEHEVEELVAGLPLNMDGTAGRMARLVRAVMAEVAEVTKLPVHEWDERLTTAAAHRVLDEAGVDRRRRSEMVDQLSASLILQGYLESR